MSQYPEDRHYTHIRSSIYYKLFVCCLMTLAAMYTHRFFPEKKLMLVPASGTTAYLYIDESPGGGSHVEWVDEKALAWRCQIEADNRDRTCGFHLTVAGGEGSRGIDLSDYDSVKVDLDYEGAEQRLRFYMRNYEPGFSDINRMETAKFNFLSIPTQYINKSLVMHFKEFSVADWWIHQFQVPREISQPNFTNVIAFGIDLNYPATPGQHNLKLNRVEFVGLWISAERWYSSILIFWVVVIIAAGAIHLAGLQQSVRIERARREKLAEKNSALEMQSKRYKQLSMRDHLTQMLNRQGLSELIEEKFAPGAQSLVALLVIDLDHFKQINDTLGHDGGDIVLREVAEIINANIRRTDYAARWGGEEFVVISPDTKMDDARFFAEKLRSLIATHCFAEFPDLRITVSIGVGVHQGEEPFNLLFRRVDVALYQAKAQGRNRTVVAQTE